jgi:hypothetical protein
MSKTAKQAPPDKAARKERTVTEVYERIARVESRLVKLMYAAGLDAHGNPLRRIPK